MKLTELQEFKRRLHNLIKELKPAYYKELLNEKGCELYEVYQAIDDLSVFYDDMQEFAKDEELNKLLLEHIKIVEVRSISRAIERAKQG